ncbi:MAG: hypothetical protein HUU21_02640 [Polyangiaceae bacterium]|nr:hypothetical protein [Polyangiaceae bacterium]
MSIKRSKQVNYKSKFQDAPTAGPFAPKPADPELSWAEHMAGKENATFTPYALTSKYEKGALIQHPKFGKGIVTQVEGTKVEVCFEEGTKKLGHAG